MGHRRHRRRRQTQACPGLPHTSPHTLHLPPLTYLPLQEVRLLLLQYGIKTQVVDRFIVTQNCQAVTSDPMQLTRHLELLIGTSTVEEHIKVLVLY